MNCVPKIYLNNTIGMASTARPENLFPLVMFCWRQSFIMSQIWQIYLCKRIDSLG